VAGRSYHYFQKWQHTPIGSMANAASSICSINSRQQAAGSNGIGNDNGNCKVNRNGNNKSGRAAYHFAVIPRFCPRALNTL